MKSKFRINVAVSWLAHLTEALVALYLMPFCSNVLGDDVYGYWLYLTAIVAHIGLLGFGLGGTISRYTADAFHRGDRAEMGRIVSAGLLIFGGLGGTFMLGLAITAACLGPEAGGGVLMPNELRWVLILLGGKVVADYVSVPFGAALCGAGYIAREQKIEIGASLARAGLLIVVLRKEWGLYWLALAMTEVSVARLFFTTWTFRRAIPDLRISLRQELRSVIRRLYSFSRFVFLDSVSNTIFQATDTLVIGQFMSKAAIVPYGIAARITKLAEAPLVRVAHAAMPEAGRLQVNGTPAELRRLVLRVARGTFLLVAGFFIGVAWFGGDLVNTWWHKPYPQSHVLMIVLVGQLMIGIPAVVIREIMLGSGFVRESSWTNLLMAALNLGLTLVLIKPLGLLGVALGTCCARLLVDPAFMLFISTKYLPIRKRDILIHVFLRPLPALAIMAVVCGLIRQQWPTISGWPAIILVGATGAGVLLAAYWVTEIANKKFITNGPPATPSKVSPEDEEAASRQADQLEASTLEGVEPLQENPL